MACGVNRSEWITIHQTLHGYSAGHREIAASTPLESSDVKLMLVLSDISGPGTRIEESGYLTGYPLVEQGAYALACTWPATEMSRPGCVWTHSILVDFTDLAGLPSLGGLTSLFRRPRGSRFLDYKRSLMFRPEPSSFVLKGQDNEWSRQLLAGLYGEPSSCVIASPPRGVSVEQVILAIWSQQWPRLRRTFRFCTMAIRDRSSEGNRFDLQILPSTFDQGVKRRFPDALDAGAERLNWEPWLNEAVIDLEQPDVSGLRTHLRRAGGDGGTGRWSFQPLCQLHRVLNELGSRSEAVGEAIALLQGDLSSIRIRNLRATVANVLIGKGGELEDDSLEFLLRHLDLLRADDLSEAAEWIGRAIWRREPNGLVRMLEGIDKLRVVPKRTFESLPIDELIEGLGRVPSIAQAVLTFRSDLLAEPAFWEHRLEIEDDAFAVLARLGEMRARAVIALVEAQREDLAARVADERGPLVVLNAVEAILRMDPERKALERWISVATRDPAVVSQFLTVDSGKPSSLLVAIARELSPSSVPNEVGEDPWLIAARSAFGLVSEHSTSYLNAYLLSRALGPSSRSAAELAQLGFESTYKAAALDRLDDEAWQLLDPVLAPAKLWDGWDKCRRITVGVVHLFVHQNLDPRVFAQLATDDKLFKNVARTAARNSRGRQYLKRVLDAMKAESKKKFSRRTRLIENLLE